MEKTFPGPDSLVRVVDICCAGKTYRRPVHKLVLLVPANEEQHSGRGGCRLTFTVEEDGVTLENTNSLTLHSYAHASIPPDSMTLVKFSLPTFVRLSPDLLSCIFSVIISLVI